MVFKNFKKIIEVNDRALSEVGVMQLIMVL